MSSLYKVYTAKRVRKEMKEKQLIPDNQIKFRKGKRTMDNVYVLNYVINRQGEKRKEWW